jgi:hypothetical protein
VTQVEKRARVAATYAKQLERKQIGENCHFIERCNGGPVVPIAVGSSSMVTADFASR